jgi:transposase-like protein
MRQRKKRRMRCSYCGSKETEKHGKRTNSPKSYSRRTRSQVQRYRCKSCQRTFIQRKEKKKQYTFGFQREMTRMHLEERLSYRVIAKRVTERWGYHISPKSICSMVNAVARLSKSSVEMQQEYRPCWSGYLTVDDKWVSVKGTRHLSLVAVDNSGDAIHSELHTESEQGVYDDFFLYLRDRLGYQLRALTTDFDPRLAKAARGVFGPDLTHQKCLWHAMEIVKALIEYPQAQRRVKNVQRQIKTLKEGLADRKQSLYDTNKTLQSLNRQLTEINRSFQEKSLLLERFRDCVFARTREISERCWKSFRMAYNKRYGNVVHFVASHWDALLEHQRDPQILRTTVRAENINKQFERRLKTIEAFQSIETAFQYQNLYRNYLRLKPYTDCRGARKACNGLSPLQLCHAVLPSSDWLKLAVRYPK